MIFQKGDNVIVKLNGTYRVGSVLHRTRLKRGLVYKVKLENGTTVDECSVNKELTSCHIHRGLTKSLNKKDGQETEETV